tara:strand:- start:58 stop:789 length:732 start_codon:yes stop_codon:yes gene_type:complete
MFKNNLPNHIAIIMDGNRRWAFERGLPSISGHKNGINTLKEIISSCLEFKIKELTIYAFSTENSLRSSKEVKNIQKLFEKTIKSEIADLNSQNIRVKFIGNLEFFEKNLNDLFRYSEYLTKNNSNLKLNIAVNYGAKSDLTHATKKIAKQIEMGNLSSENISEETIREYLISAQVPDIDLLIRTSGEKRISNFMFWQLSYSEIIFSNILWPDFNKKCFLDAINEYSNRKRTFGINHQNQNLNE